MVVRRRLLMPLVAASLALAVAVPATADATSSEAVRQVIEALEAANNRGDVDQWVGLFAEDFVYMLPGMAAISDRGELIEVARAGFRNKATIEITPLEVQVCDGWAFVRTTAKGSVNLHTTGEVLEVDVKELLVLVRGSDGVWRIARLMNNSNK